MVGDLAVAGGRVVGAIAVVEVDIDEAEFTEVEGERPLIGPLGKATSIFRRVGNEFDIFEGNFGGGKETRVVADGVIAAKVSEEVFVALLLKERDRFILGAKAVEFLTEEEGGVLDSNCIDHLGDSGTWQFYASGQRSPWVLEADVPTHHFDRIFLPIRNG